MATRKTASGRTRITGSERNEEQREAARAAAILKRSKPEAKPEKDK